MGLSELVSETPADKLRPKRPSTRTESQGTSSDLSGTEEDSDIGNSGDDDSSGEYIPPSELPEYQKRTDRKHTGKKSKERKHKWNGFFIQKEGLDEVWKTRRIEFHGEQNWIRRQYGYLYASEIVMTRSENVQKRY